MVQADACRVQGDLFIQWKNNLPQGLGYEDICNCLRVLAKQNLADFVEHNGRNEQYFVTVKVRQVQIRFCIFGDVFQPAGGINEDAISSGRSGHDNLPSIASP